MLVRGHIFLSLFFLHNIPLDVQSIDSFSRDLLHENTRKLFFSLFLPGRFSKHKFQVPCPDLGRLGWFPGIATLKFYPGDSNGPGKFGIR